MLRMKERLSDYMVVELETIMDRIASRHGNLISMIKREQVNNKGMLEEINDLANEFDEVSNEHFERHGRFANHNYWIVKNYEYKLGKVTEI